MPHSEPLQGLNAAQRAEVNKYVEAYQHPNYHMGVERFNSASDDLRSIECRDGYLDVGCGRGEMLDVARGLGFENVRGVEVVDTLVGADDAIVQAAAWDLPFEDGAFDVVSLFDVIEHLRPEDTTATVEELARVARKTLIITAANYSSRSLGVELHVNRMAYDDWDRFFRRTFADAEVTWLPRRHGINSETWRIDLGSPGDA